jgi:exopolysaccharide production protein ExoQ
MKREQTSHPAALPNSGEKCFVVLVLLLSTGAFSNLRVNGPILVQQMGGGIAAMEVLWLIVYLVTIVLYFRCCVRPLRGLLAVTPFFVLAAFAFASASWSQDPALSVRRSLALGLTVVFGVYFASRFTLKSQFRLLAWTFAICIIFSFFFQLLGLNPDVGTPGWYGIFYIKNELGRVMVLSALIFLFWMRVEPEHKRMGGAGFVGSLALVALSRSMTSVVVLFLLMVLLPYLRWTLRKSVRWAVAGIAFLLIVGTSSVIYVVAHLEEITGFLGRSPTLTGRVPLWILSFVMALRRPWLGYGFNAFWLPDNMYVQKIWNLLRWQPPHAHNGFLELWLELGLVGAALFLLVFA